MPSPVSPSDFQSLIPSATGSTCDKLLRALFTFPTKFHEWYSWVYNEDGSFTDDFKTEVCGIDCTSIGSGGALATPTLSAGGLLPTTIPMSWGAVAGASYYDVVKNTVPDLLSAQPVTTTTLTTFTDSAVTPDTTFYFYWVRARTATVLGSFSAYQCLFCGTLPTLTTPVIVPTTTIPDFCRTTWTPPTGSHTYEVRRNTANNYAAATVLGTTIYPFWDDFSGILGANYYYFVRTYNMRSAESHSTGVIGVRT